MSKGAGKKGKRADDRRPARKIYWSSGRLRENKVRNLCRCNGMTEKEAIKYWESDRVLRRKAS